MEGKLASWHLAQEGLTLTVIIPRNKKKGVRVSIDPYEAFRLAQEIIGMWKPVSEGFHSPLHEPGYDFVAALHDQLYPQAAREPDYPDHLQPRK